MNKKTLWFITGVATALQIDFARRNALTIRDSTAYQDGDLIEKADAVCGDAPKAYLDKYDVADIDFSGLESSDDDKPDKQTELTSKQIKALLAEKGIEFNANASKAELSKLLEETQQVEKQGASE
ncbi:HeH/LEM domain-containing protein [Thorsellia anophelis]|uniref:HeH/LEM domain-containing protein n=1 Tax=Thorsellia anophelis DSM 18579 TaxID=1123402 RepID=A0A1I0D7U3_9GAMM|nr:HeH/LEM domain-containing protein [Thorsellia anophelis]SET28303.1 HeH/LEM domain-containing protein [Thorsellia anophelis DSM 18579]